MLKISNNSRAPEPVDMIQCIVPFIIENVSGWEGKITAYMFFTKCFPVRLVKSHGGFILECLDYVIHEKRYALFLWESEPKDRHRVCMSTAFDGKGRYYFSGPCFQWVLRVMKYARRVEDKFINEF